MSDETHTSFIRKGAESAMKTLMFWKLSIIRCMIFGGIVAWGMFHSGVEGFDSLSDMTPLQLTKLFGNMFFTGFCGVLVAFLDQSLQQLSDKPKPNP